MANLLTDDGTELATHGKLIVVELEAGLLHGNWR